MTIELNKRFMNQIEQGRKLEQTLLQIDGENIDERRLGIFLRRQRHPSMTNAWGNLATPDHWKLLQTLSNKYFELQS